MNWSLQDEKSRLSEIVKRARSEGPQTVTLRGERAAIVISAEDYDRLAARNTGFVDLLLSGPDWPDDFVEDVNRRRKSPGREIDFQPRTEFCLSATKSRSDGDASPPFVLVAKPTA